jgi:dynein heavy chain
MLVNPPMRKWDIVTYFKTSIDTFKSVLSLIKSLREKYMRERHWGRLQKDISQSIDPEADDFTFD